MISLEHIAQLARIVYFTYVVIRFRYRMNRRIETVKKRAEFGEATSQAIIGTLFSKGLGVSQNTDEAFKWYCKAANQGHTGAQFIVGTWYATGRGVGRDYIKAYQWYYKAATHENPRAYVALGLMYAQGIGVPRDQERAKSWFRLARACCSRNRKDLNNLR